MSPDRRLHHRWEYKNFFNKSEAFRLAECIVFRIRNDLPHFRLGITLKARGSSIERNQVKRQIREAFRTHSELLGSFDYNVVIPAQKKMAYPYPHRLGTCLRKQFASKIRSNS